MSDQMMLLIGLGGVFLGVVLLLATIGVITSERQAVGRSLAAVEAIQTAPKALRSELDQPFRHRVVVPVMGRLSGIGRTLSPDQVQGYQRRYSAWKQARSAAIGAAEGRITVMYDNFGGVVNVNVAGHWAIMLLIAGIFVAALAGIQRAKDRL